MRSLHNKIVVVSGASAGIGRAIALAFADEGAHVAVLARDSERLQSLCAQIQSSSIVKQTLTLPVPTDVADSRQIEAAAELVETQLGPIDIWVNNAMVTLFSPFHEITDDEFRQVTQVTYLGTVYGTQAALKRMRPRNRGHIVQVGSALSYQAIPLQSAYCGAKHAVRGFTNALRAELIHDKLDIGLSMVQLSAFNTPQFEWARTRSQHRPQPLPPIYQPEIAAKAIIETIKQNRREMWVGFPAVKAIIGGKLMPALMEKVLAKKAYSGQFTDEPLDSPREGNLFQTVSGDYGVHGRFDQQSRNRSIQVLMSIHRKSISIGLLVFLIICAGILIGVSISS